MNLFSRIKKIKIKGSVLLSVVIVSGIIGTGIAGMNHYMHTRIVQLEHERLNSIAMSLNKESINVFTSILATGQNNNIGLVIKDLGVDGYVLQDVNALYGQANQNIRFTDEGNGGYQIQFFHEGGSNFAGATTTISLNIQDLNDTGTDLVQWKANVRSDIVTLSDKNYSYDYDILLTLPIVRLNPQKQSCVILINTRGGKNDSIYSGGRYGCTPLCYNSATLYIPALPNTPPAKNPSYEFDIIWGVNSNIDTIITSYSYAHSFHIDAYNRCTGGERDLNKLISKCGVREKLPAIYRYKGVNYQLLQDSNHNWFNDEDDNWWRTHPWWEQTKFENKNPCGGDCVCFVAKNQISPLVIDLKGDGIRYTGYADPLYFDFGSGSKTATTWLYNTDTAGFLALDKDNDGMIKTGKELFGDLTDKNSKNGFEALKIYDKNKDNLIDDKDAVWNKLLIWNDLNRNAIGEKEELTFIKDTDIKSISLDYEQKREQPDPYDGSVSKQSSFAFKKDGTKLKVYDIYFMNVLNAEKLAKNKK